MRLWISAAFLIALTAAGVVLAQGEKPAAEGGEHDFGAKVLGVVTLGRGGKEDRGGGYVEKAKVRRMGDRYFLVGQVPDMGEKFKESKGMVVWTPLSEIVQIIEYESLESVQKIIDEFDKARKDR